MEFKEVTWNKDFEIEHAKHMGDFLDVIKFECKTRIAKIWTNGKVTFILGADGTELVIMYMQGSDMSSALEAIIEYGKENFNSIRFDSYRKGAERLMKKYGFKRRFIQMVMEFENG